MNKKRLLLLNGSPRRKGTSFSFTRTIKNLSQDKGHTADIIHIIDYFNERITKDSVRSVISECDIIGLVAPLYVDTLPYPVIWFFEELYEVFREELHQKSFFVIGQCGFPDTTLLKPLLGSCRCFCLAVEMKWLGGLAYGGGSIIDGSKLEDLGKKGERITSGLSLALENVLDEEEISLSAQDKIREKIPRVLFRPLALLLNYKIRKTARELGATDFEKKAYLE